MCGIAGWFSKNTSDCHELDALKRMISAIRHRGPDEQGIKILPHVFFGHVRLSIIDLKNGQQPMTSHDGKYCIIFNGEIYNYKELRNKLLKSGHKFISHCDTEVIMEIYRKHGHEGFSKLRGMYAFALWDNENKVGVLARDPFGIKPLFIQLTKNTGLVFASEAKAILAKNNATPEMDLSQLHFLLNFRYLPGNNSLFSGIKQLDPGCVLQWSVDGKFNQFTIKIPSTDSGSTLEQLDNSVVKHLTADVEVGCYLSGGIDSATIVALSKKTPNNGLRTFTVAVGDDPQEAANAAQTAKYFEVENLQSKISSNISEDLHQLIWHLEKPKINAIQNWQLAKFTSQHVKVALSGLGGDELFLGYNVHKIMLWAKSVTKFTPTPLTRIVGSAFKESIKKLNKLRWSESERAMAIANELGNWPIVYGLIRNVWDNAEMRQFIYGERMLDSRLPDVAAFLGDSWPNHPDPVTNVAKFEWQHKLVNDLLWQEDRVSMAHGLEVRTPLVDVQLYSHMQNIERETLMRNGQPKAYMKAAVRSILPNNILNRPKSGFQVASYDFFHQHLRQLADEQLNEQKIKEIGLFNYKFVKHVLQFPATRRLRWHYFILYFMLLSHLWIEVFEIKSWQKPN
ncbi:MAG: asparagine synthase (glutamine-hydrolyzing) [Gammaproteobacteria bacterium]|nr:asparagine synthase (glutamine-hydrolyzing) [Gammaproteobacteria bacterium]